MAVFRKIVLRGLDAERDGVGSWTAKELWRGVDARFGITDRESGMLELLHSLGRSWQKTRPSRPKAQAVVIMDRAGWHRANALAVPSNLTLAFSPPSSPERNVIERVWLHLKERHLPHRVWPNHEAILDVVCDAWNKLIDESGRLKPFPIAWNRSL